MPSSPTRSPGRRRRCPPTRSRTRPSSPAGSRCSICATPKPPSRISGLPQGRRRPAEPRQGRLLARPRAGSAGASRPRRRPSIAEAARVYRYLPRPARPPQARPRGCTRSTVKPPAAPKADADRPLHAARCRARRGDRAQGRARSRHRPRVPGRPAAALDDAKPSSPWSRIWPKRSATRRWRCASPRPRSAAGYNLMTYSAIRCTPSRRSRRCEAAAGNAAAARHRPPGERVQRADHVGGRRARHPAGDADHRAARLPDYKIKCDIPRLMTDNSYNTMMAAAYIGDRMGEFQGSYVLGIAGYNAGPGRARQWIREFGDPRDPKRRSDRLDPSHPLRGDARVRAEGVVERAGLPRAAGERADRRSGSPRIWRGPAAPIWPPIPAQRRAGARCARRRRNAATQARSNSHTPLAIAACNGCIPSYYRTLFRTRGAADARDVAIACPRSPSPLSGCSSTGCCG